MLKATKTLILVSAMVLPLLTVETNAQPRAALVAEPGSLADYTAVLHDVRDRLDNLEELLLDPVNGVNGVVYAGTTVVCKGGKSFHIRVDGGSCKIDYDGHGNAISGQCLNDAGDHAGASCSYNNGQGGCSSTSSGSGDCTPK